MEDKFVVKNLTTTQIYNIDASSNVCNGKEQDQSDGKGLFIIFKKFYYKHNDV